MPIELKTEKGSISLTTPKFSGESVDLSNYYTKPEVDALIPDVSDFATRDDVAQAVSDKVTIEDVNNATANLASTEYVDNAVNSIDLSDYALKSEIPSLDEYAKMTDIPDVSGYQTEDQVNALINTALNNIGVAEDGAY